MGLFLIIYIFLGYLLVYFLKGKLPWMNTTGLTREEKHEKILKIKQSIKVEDLCEGLPKEFIDYFNYVKDLGFNDTPNYSNLKKMFRTLFAESNFSTDSDFDWNIPKDTSLLNISKESDITGDMVSFFFSKEKDINFFLSIV
jgi:hypothetical protein